MVIRSFRHRGLRRLYDHADTRDLKQDQVRRIQRILSMLDGAGRLEDIDLLPGMHLHSLRGNLAGFWSVSVSGNWRIIFRFEEGSAQDVDLVDYH
jgi:proteic killer suppression protein